MLEKILTAFVLTIIFMPLILYIGAKLYDVQKSVNEFDKIIEDVKDEDLLDKMKGWD